ncbi:hypothetical protein DBR32_08100 [Taibaiella sp. KBW10]|uniref:T9SS type B sorting domain-containing protein n=1 Tax=Taibaiella sp. KBW10 TaxID=2153357 RepID=UPI000F5A5FF1|nr:gliding motility-associated C-terminal domain-containing protein [Taibaiella sp. KBW10]RQO30684.1 hypothetical protein DBR32_08100 [Taibaiella sp. KBW10]
MKKIYKIYLCVTWALTFLLLLPSGIYAQITAIGNTGQTTTNYPGGITNVPIYVWCATGSATPASLRVNPATAGSYTFNWYKFDANTTSWQAYTTANGTSSTINNLPSGGYRVEIANGANAIIECYHTWVWNLGGTVSITNPNPNCTTVGLTAGFNVQDTFKYYTPPPPTSYINANTQIQVCFTATHTYVSDLAFYLIGPASCGSPAILLSPNPGGSQSNICNSGDNVNNLCFSTTSVANFNVCGAATPLTGTYGKYGPNSTPINWAPLIGCNAIQGGWKVQIFDCIGQDVGSLTNANVTFSNLTTTCGSPTSITYNSGTINSAINDNSCNSASASVFNVPVSYTATPLSTFATRSIAWSTSTSGASIANTTAAATTATIPAGTSNFTLSVSYTVGGTTCTVTGSNSYTNNLTPVASRSPINKVICSGQAINTSLSSTLNNTTFSWTVAQNGVTGASNGSGNNIAHTLTTTGSTQGTVIYSITPTRSGCVGATIMDTVKVNPLLTATKNITICANQLPYTWNGINVTAGGAAAATYHTPSLVTGCDSTTNLNLTVNPLLTATKNLTICASQLPYNWNGINVTAGGTAVATYHTPSLITGCDSATTLNLTVNPLLTATRNVTICASQLPYIWNGISVTAGGTAVATYHTPSLITGCDSATTLNLTVNPLLTATRSVTICASQLPYVWNGISVTAGGATAAVYHTPSLITGCDSATTLNLTVNPLLTATRNVTICASQLPYSWNGINVTTGGATAAVYHTPSLSTGCDSATTLNLTVNPLLTATRNVTICASQLPYSWNGINVTAGGTAVATYHTPSLVTGCDSATTLNLTVNPLLTATRNVTICANQLPYSWNGINVTAGGTAVAIYHAPSLITGCDSATTLNLTVNPNPTATQSITICANQLPYIWNSISVTAGGTTAATYHTPSLITGCDSITTLNLTVNPMLTPSFTAIASICQGGTFLLPTTANNGVTGTWSPVINNMATTTYTFTPTPGLCALTNTMTVVVRPVTYGTQNTIICNGESYLFNGVYHTITNNTAKDTFVNGVGCDSIVTLNLIVMPVNPVQKIDRLSGCGAVTYLGNVYTASTIVYDTLYTQYGCDSIYHEARITVFPQYSYTEDRYLLGCTSYTLNGQTYYNSTVISDTLRTINGCDSVYRTNNIEIETFDLTATYTPEDPYEGEYIKISTSNDLNIPYTVISWTPSSLFNNQTATAQQIALNTATNIVVMAESKKGCKDTATLSIGVRPYKKDVMMPNAFSPNGDGRNDVFIPILAIDRAYRTVDFRVFNRLGQVLFTTANINKGWDGTFQGQLQSQGVYFYTLTLVFLDGTSKTYKGDITLIK